MVVIAIRYTGNIRADHVQEPFRVDAVSQLQAKLSARAVAVLVPGSVAKGTEGAAHTQAELSALPQEALAWAGLRVCKERQTQEQETDAVLFHRDTCLGKDLA